MSELHILDAASAGSQRGGPSFSLLNRIERAVWAVAWGLLAAWTPPPLHGWRRLVLGLFGAKIARTARIHGSVRIWLPRHLVVGENALVGPRVTLYSMAMITLGADSVVSQGAHLCTGTHDPDDLHFQLLAKPISIGPRAWVAAEAFVGPGVTIAEGAILGARAVAFKDVPAWSIQAGNPARHVRMRRLQ